MVWVWWRGRTLNGLSFARQNAHPLLKMKWEAEAEVAVLMATPIVCYKDIQVQLNGNRVE